MTEKSKTHMTEHVKNSCFKSDPETNPHLLSNYPPAIYSEARSQTYKISCTWQYRSAPTLSCPAPKPPINKNVLDPRSTNIQTLGSIPSYHCMLPIPLLPSENFYLWEITHLPIFHTHRIVSLGVIGIFEDFRSAVSFLSYDLFATVSACKDDTYCSFVVFVVNYCWIHFHWQFLQQNNCQMYDC